MECSLCDNQGWFLSNDVDWNDEIQKCDTCNVFKSDKEAQEFEAQKKMIKLIKKILGVDVEIESLNTKVNRMEKALTNLEYKVADLSVICTFLNELRKEENNENNK